MAGTVQILGAPVLRHARVRSPAPNLEEWNVIDRLRKQIQERLDQLMGEADRLRKALVALDPRSSTMPARKPTVSKPARATATKPAPSTTKRTTPGERA